MSQISIRLLGPFQVTINLEPVAGFKYAKVRALLAYLAMEAEIPHQREALAALFWPDQSSKLARQSLRQSLSILRRAIRDQDRDPPFLLVTNHTIQFNRSAATWLDVAALRASLTRAQNHAHAYPDVESCSVCVQHLQEAVALYRGDFLQDLLLGDSVEFDDWTIIHRERLRTQVLSALYHITRHYLHRGQYTQAQAYALRQVEIEPYREEAYRQLMRILARSGQHSAALAQYERCRRTLSQELGLEPTQETQALYERLCAARETCPHNLPLQVASLIGRAGELEQIAENLANPDCRLLTLTGLGGIGKTHLALEAAREHVGIFLHGVYWVRLAPVSSVDFLVSTIADALDFNFSGSQDLKTQLLNYLREKEMLLVLDNVEHLLEGIPLLLDILRHAPDVKMMVTSRERLNVRAEWVFHVRELPFPETPVTEDVERYGAIQLFYERARRADAGFSLSTTIIAAVVRICQLVGGVPLGIELAAASVAAFSCAQIAEQIAHNLNALATPMRDVPERHRSLHAVFEHSWHLLSTEEQQAFRRLALFQGGFEVSAARAVARATPSILASLVNKSLLRATASGRYEIHRLVRQFAMAKLDEPPNEKEMVHERHCEYYAAFLHQRADALKAGQQKQVLTEIGVEIDNIRVAWQWAVVHTRWQSIDRGLESLYYFYWARNWFHEGKQMLAQAERVALAPGAEDDLFRARIWTRQAEFDAWLAHYDEAKARLRQSIGICRKRQAQRELAIALDLLGRIEYWQGEYSPAKEHFRETLAIYRQLDDIAGMAQALNGLANVTCEFETDYDQAQRFYEESLTLARQIGDQFGIAKALINLGALAQEIGHYREARQLYRESLDVYREIDYRHGQSAVLGYLGQVSSLLGEHTLAQELLEEGLQLNRETGDRRAMAERFNQLGSVACRMAVYPEARRYFEQGLECAMGIQAFQVVLDILIGVVNLYLQEGQKARALELLIGVMHQIGDSQERKDHAMVLLPECEAGLSPQVVARCHQQGKILTLTEIVARVMDE